MAETATSGELRDIRDVAEVLRQARERGEPASVLIGAGASVTAGIPLATGFVDEVRRRFPNGYERAVEKTYPHVMREINDGERHELISHYVRAARLNWAHVLLGWLVREGFVGRILTTNFDNLAVRCTALYELYPAVYDVTALESFDASLVRDPAVFFLHGQHSGFVQLHTRDEVEENARRLHPVFAEATVRRPWIVLGYSGDNDPVFECLTAVRRFHYGLYWVGYRDNPPNPDVQARLLDRRRQAYWVRGHDADGFMIKLFRELGLEMPPLFADPFSHGLSLLEKLAPFPTGIHEGEVDFTAAARSHLAAAKRWFLDGHPPEADERHHEQVLVTLQGYFLRGDFDRIIAYANDTPPSKLVPVITAALATRASGAAERVRDALRLGGPFEGLLARVIEDLDRVLALSPEFAEAYCDRASARLMAAEVTRGEAEFDALVERARSDLHEALQREPGMYEALHNLAYCDALEAARQQGAARAAHLERAVAGYRRALELTREGLLTHVFLARALSEFDDRAHLAEAERHLDRAEVLDPRHPELLASRLAVGFRNVSYLSLEGFAATVRRLTKYADALAELEPETPRGRLFSGFVRLLLAAFTEDPAARSQFDAGMSQFEAARRVMPTPRGAERMLADLEFVVAAALYAEAGHRASPRREQLRARADEGFAEAVRRGEDTKHVLRLWGMLVMHQAAEEEAGERRHELVAVARDKFEAALGLAPDDVDTYCDWAEGWVNLIAESEPSEANSRYYGQAVELLRRVSERHSEMAPINIVWADACRALGQTLADPQHARFLLRDAVTRSSRATELAPETSEAWIKYGECAEALAQSLAEDETAEAIELLRRAVYAFSRAGQLDPGVEPLVHQASTLLELAELDRKRGASLLTEAQVLLERAVQRFPDVRELVFLLLELHDQRRDVHAFSVTLRRAAELIPPMTRQEVEQEEFDLLKGQKLPQALTDALGLLPLAPMSDGMGSAEPPGPSTS